MTAAKCTQPGCVDGNCPDCIKAGTPPWPIPKKAKVCRPVQGAGEDWAGCKCPKPGIRYGNWKWLGGKRVCTACGKEYMKPCASHSAPNLECRDCILWWRITPAAPTESRAGKLPKLKVAYRRPYGLFIVREDDMYMTEAELQEIIRRAAHPATDTDEVERLREDLKRWQDSAVSLEKANEKLALKLADALEAPATDTAGDLARLLMGCREVDAKLMEDEPSLATLAHAFWDIEKAALRPATQPADDLKARLEEAEAHAASCYELWAGLVEHHEQLEDAVATLLKFNLPVSAMSAQKEVQRLLSLEGDMKPSAKAISILRAATQPATDGLREKAQALLDYLNSYEIHERVSNAELDGLMTDLEALTTPSPQEEK